MIFYTNQLVSVSLHFTQTSWCQFHILHKPTGVSFIIFNTYQLVLVSYFTHSNWCQFHILHKPTGVNFIFYTNQLVSISYFTQTNWCQFHILHKPTGVNFIFYTNQLVSISYFTQRQHLTPRSSSYRVMLQLSLMWGSVCWAFSQSSVVDGVRLHSHVL